MRKISKTCQYGGHGVDIKLDNFGSHEGRVFWKLPEHNSYVMVPDPRGGFKTPDGTTVSILSINGIGEIRWSVQDWGPSDREAAVVAAFEVVSK